MRLYVTIIKSEFIFSHAHNAHIQNFTQFAILLQSLQLFALKNGLHIYLFWILIRRHRAHDALCRAAYISEAVKLPIPMDKTSRLSLRVRRENWRFFCSSLQSWWIILEKHDTLHSTKTAALSMRHMLLCHFYITAHRQYCISVFSSIKCLDFLLNLLTENLHHLFHNSIFVIYWQFSVYEFVQCFCSKMLNIFF